MIQMSRFLPTLMREECPRGPTKFVEGEVNINHDNPAPNVAIWRPYLAVHGVDATSCVHTYQIKRNVRERKTRSAICPICGASGRNIVPFRRCGSPISEVSAAIKAIGGMLLADFGVVNTGE